MARGRAERPPLRRRARQPRSALPGKPFAGNGLARPRGHAPNRSRLCRFRALARRHPRAGGARPAQARPQARRRGRLAALRRHRAPQAQPAPGAGARCDAGGISRAAPGRGSCRDDALGRRALGQARRRSEGGLEIIRWQSDRARSLASDPARRPARDRRPERRRQDDAPEPPHRVARRPTPARSGSAPISAWPPSTSAANR